MPNFKQLVTPNLNIKAQAAWCLGYVTNTIGGSVTGEDNEADNNAQQAWEELKRYGKTRDGEPPVGIWAPVWWSIDEAPMIWNLWGDGNYGTCKGLGHVAWAFNHGNGYIEIYDSEVARGAKAPYTSLADVPKWFAGNGTRMTYLGWSINVAGKQVVSEDGTSNNAGSAENEIKKENLPMEFMFTNKNGKDGVYWVHDGVRTGFNENNGGADAKKVIEAIYQSVNGKPIFYAPYDQATFDILMKLYPEQK